MISETANSFDPYIGADTCKLFTQKSHIYFNVIFNGVGIKAPHFGKKRFLGNVIGS